MFFKGDDATDHAQPILGIFDGVIIATSTTDNETFWHVLYPKDKSEEDSDMQDMRHYIIDKYTTLAAWNGSDQARKQRVKPSLPTATVDAGTHITAAPEHEPDPYERVLV